jgi:hypothetical protein
MISSFRGFQPKFRIQLKEDGLFIALMMESANTSETLVNFYQTTGATTQKTVIFILVFLETRNLTVSSYFSHPR